MLQCFVYNGLRKLYHSEDFTFLPFFNVATRKLKITSEADMCGLLPTSTGKQSSRRYESSHKLLAERGQ